MKHTVKITLKEYLLITLGSIVYAAGVALFLDPNDLAPGGVSGIAILLSEFIKGLNVGLIIIIINIPIMIIGVINFGFKFLFSSIYAVAVSSLSMWLFSFLPTVTNEKILAAVAGGILQAVGIGLVFRNGATTGGSDIVVKLLRKRFRHIKTGTIFFVIDFIVVSASGIVFRNFDVVLYAGIALAVYMTVFNVVLYGGDEARLVYIISSKKEEIAKRILSELDAGATLLEGKGAYTGQKRDVLMVVMRMRMLPEARDIVREEDKNAFMIVTQASSVFGEGFKSHDEEDL